MVDNLEEKRSLPACMVQRRLMSRILGSKLGCKAAIIITGAFWLIAFTTYKTINDSAAVSQFPLNEELSINAGQRGDSGSGSVQVSVRRDKETADRVPPIQESLDLKIDRSASTNMEEEAQGRGGLFRPGQPWYDTDGNLIQAHGGGILSVPEHGTFYWYGENKDGDTYRPGDGLSRVDFIGFNCYMSKDLLTWENLGLALKADYSSFTHDLHPSRVAERPKVLYNKLTKKYVMWLHVDDPSYQMASIGVAISDLPEGPFKYLFRMRPHDTESRDFTIFKDVDEVAYIAYSSEGNHVMHVSRLTDNYLNVALPMNRILVGRSREAPAIFKHKQTFYMVTSGCTGWHPNAAEVHEATDFLGPWTSLGDPCVGGDEDTFQKTTFMSQGTFVLPLPGIPNMYILMADRWHEHDLRNSRYVWVPLSISFRPGQQRVVAEWKGAWKLPTGWNSTSRTSS